MTCIIILSAATLCRDMGVDGLMTWFARWPHGDIERAWLGQIGDASHGP